MKKRYKSAGIILIRNDKRILLQHRTNNAPEGAGEWGLFGGTAQKGETHLTALKRELLEELEYEVKSPKLLLSHRGEDRVGTYSARIYCASYDKTQRLSLHEGQGMKWFHIDEAIKKVKNPVFLTGLKKFKQLLSRGEL